MVNRTVPRHGGSVIHAETCKDPYEILFTEGPVRNSISRITTLHAVDHFAYNESVNTHHTVSLSSSVSSCGPRRRVPKPGRVTLRHLPLFSNGMRAPRASIKSGQRSTSRTRASCQSSRHPAREMAAFPYEDKSWPRLVQVWQQVRIEQVY